MSIDNKRQRQCEVPPNKMKTESRADSYCDQYQYLNNNNITTTTTDDNNNTNNNYKKRRSNSSNDMTANHQIRKCLYASSQNRSAYLSNKINHHPLSKRMPRSTLSHHLTHCLTMVALSGLLMVVLASPSSQAHDKGQRLLFRRQAPPSAVDVTLAATLAPAETESPPPPPTTLPPSASTVSSISTVSPTQQPQPSLSPQGAVSNSEAPKSGQKYPPVNFTQVEQLFTQVFDEPEVRRKWQKMDKTLTDGIRAILKIVFPHIVSMSSDAKVSGNCSGAILKWILSLRNMREWAVKMLDAIGKPNAGLLEGSLTMFGNYKQCLKVRAPDEDEIELNDEEFREYFRGQYCVLQIRPPLPKRQEFYSLNTTIQGLLRTNYKYYEKNVYDSLAELAMAFNFVSIRADLCVPSLCSRDDIQRVADFLVSKVDMRARVQRCDVEPFENESQLEQSHLLWSMIFVILLLLVLISTLTSMVFKRRSNHHGGSSTLNGGSSPSKLSHKSKSIFTSMSVYRSLSHMKNVQMDRINDSKPVVLYSLRLLIVLWIFLISLTSQLDFQYLRELLSLRSVIMQWPMQFLVNSSLAYDALILLTAFTYSYQNINSNLVDLVKYNASKYSRLMPSIMFLVAITIITPLLYPNRSPVWHDFVDEPAQVCKEMGFVNLLFLQNFLSASRICLPQTWIFCVELQLCLLAIPLVYMLNKTFDSNQGQFRLTSGPVLLLILSALFGCLINFQNIYKNSLPAAWFLTFPDKADRELYFSLHLYKTWTHLTTFSVGLLAGHLCRCLSFETFSGRPYGRKCCDNLMWLTSAVLMGAIIFSTHSWSLGGVAHIEAPIASASYAAIAPLLWAISWSFILFLLTVPSNKHQQQRCCSALTRLLASDVNLVRIGRLTFLAYLINPYVNQFVLALQEQAIFSSILMLAHTFLGNLVITFALSFIVSALVELPCRRLIKKLIIGPRRHSTNFDMITRQLNMRTPDLPAGNGGQSRDSFTPTNRHHHHQHQQQQQHHPQSHQLGFGGEKGLGQQQLADQQLTRREMP